MSTPPPELGDLSPFEEIPEVSEDCVECPIAQSFIREALAKRAIAQAILDAIYKRPEEEVLVESIKEQPEIGEMLRMFFVETGEYEEDQLETPEQIIEAMVKNQGEGVNDLIEKANESILHAKKLLDNCEAGLNSVIVPRPNRRPARLNYCDGAINSAGYREDVETTITVEEID